MADPLTRDHSTAPPDPGDTGIGAWEWDVGTGAVTWSAVMYSIHGVGEGDFAGTAEAYVPLVHPEDAPIVEGIIRDLLAGAESRPVEYRIVRPDGEVRYVLGTNERVLDAVGRPIRIRGTVRDISELRQESLARSPERAASEDERNAREALRRSEQRFRALVEHSYDVITLFGADGTVLYTTPSVERVLGYKPEELIGRPGADLVHPDDLERANASFAAALAEPGARTHMIHRTRHKDGTYRLVEITGSNLLDDPAVGALVSNLRDVTERNEADEALRQAQKMEAVGRLAGGVAHDFNNLLTVILGEVEMALAGDAIPPEVTAGLERIRSSGERAASLTHQLLAFSRKELVRPVALDLNAVLRQAAEMLCRLIEEDVTLEMRLSADLWPVWADRSQIEQLLLNLVVNARDAMPEGGVIEIATANVTIGRRQRDRGLPAGNYVRLRVRDGGMGMSEEVRRHVFEPFYTTKGSAGTGLGLATCYSVAKQHGGDIDLDSREGVGTTATVLLPRGRDPEVADVAPVAAPPRRGDTTILLVEDEASVRDLAAEMLRRAGYEVLTAACAEEALALVDERLADIDLVLTDVVLPGRSGRELAEEVARRDPAMPVLFASGYTADAVIRRGVREDELDLIQKPFTAAELTRRVQEILER